ncbi:MAG TPA: IclR family transcriptional regulator [Streptosporangiales bacterium]
MSGKQPASYMGRLLDVLDATITAAEPPTVTEIAEAAATPMSTTSRLVGLLTEKGFLIQAHGRYSAGPRLTHVALRVLDQIHDTDRLVAATRELSASSGESVSAGVLVGDSIVLVARTESPQSLRAVARVGDIIDPHTSALGKAILSRLPYDRGVQLVRAGTGGAAEHVLAELADELVTARETGYALDEETYTVGLRCRAAAIRGHDGQAVGGISIAGPSARFTPDAAAAVVPALLETVDRLSVHPRSS